eukprot:COSAG02_NODE_290_length_25531_cov_75.132392_19_plen_54_part_00
MGGGCSVVAEAGCRHVASNDSGPLLVKFGDTRGHREHKTRRNGYHSTPPQYNL